MSNHTIQATAEGLSKNSNGADLSDLIGMDFEKWEHAEGEWEPPSNQKWCDEINPTLLTVRLAWAALYHSKEELADLIKTQPEAILQLLKHIDDAKSFLEPMKTILECAWARLAVVAAEAPDQKLTII